MQHKPLVHVSQLPKLESNKHPTSFLTSYEQIILGSIIVGLIVRLDKRGRWNAPVLQSKVFVVVVEDVIFNRLQCGQNRLLVSYLHMITTAYESLNTPSTPVPRCGSYLLYVSTPSQHLLRQGPTVTLPFYCNLVIQRCVSVNRQLLRRLDARGGSEKQVFPHNPRRQKSATSHGEVTDVKVRCTHDLPSQFVHNLW